MQIDPMSNVGIMNEVIAHLQDTDGKYQRMLKVMFEPGNILILAAQHVAVIDKSVFPWLKDYSDLGRIGLRYVAHISPKCKMEFFIQAALNAPDDLKLLGSMNWEPIYEDLMTVSAFRRDREDSIKYLVDFLSGGLVQKASHGLQPMVVKYAESVASARKGLKRGYPGLTA